MKIVFKEVDVEGKPMDAFPTGSVVRSVKNGTYIYMVIAGGRVADLTNGSTRSVSEFSDLRYVLVEATLVIEVPK